MTHRSRRNSRPSVPPVAPASLISTTGGTDAAVQGDERTEAVIYCRVSSERQAKEGDGARSQEQRCRNYVEANGHLLLAAFSDDGISGASVARPGLDALLAFVASRRDTLGRETVVVVDDISRLARDVPAHLRIRAEIRTAGGRLESPSFTFGDSAADELVETIMAATAQFGRKGNREQVFNRMRARLEQGYWTFPPPLGYRFERHPVHKKLLVPTDAARDILRPALAGYADGRFQTQRELARFLGANGFFADRRTTAIDVLEKRVSRVMDLIALYAGMVEYPAWGITRRAAHHEPLVTPAQLHRIERRLSAPGRPWGAERADSRAAFILRNFVRCNGCGRPLTGSLAKGQYPRYHCYNQGCALYGDSYSARRKIEPAFLRLLERLAPRPEFMDLVGMQAGRFAERSEEEARQAREASRRELDASRREVQQLVRRIARASSDAAASAMEAELDRLTRTAAEAEARLTDDRADDFRAAWDAVNTWFGNPAEAWRSGSETQKRTVHRIVFTVPPAFDPDTGFNTYGLSLPYLVSEGFKGLNGKMVDLTGESSHLFWETVRDWAALSEE